MVGIYKITNTLNNKCYIGQSIDIETRWTQHKSDGKYHRTNNKLYSAMFHDGIENFIFEIIEECECDAQVLNEREKYWIEYYDSYNNGYNSTTGGQGENGWIYDSNLIHQLWDKGYSISEIIDIVGCSRTLVHERLKNYENYNPKESNLRGREHNLKIPFNKETPIHQYSINGDYIASYRSINQAAREVHGISSNICSCLNNSNQKIAYGYQWSREKVDKLPRVPIGNSRMVRCIETNQIFYSMVEAAKWAGLKSNSSIKDCCKGRNKTAGKHPETGEKLRWEYVE